VVSVSEGATASVRDSKEGGREREDARRQVVERLAAAGHAEDLHHAEEARHALGAEDVLEEVVGERRAAVGSRDGRQGPHLEVGRLEARDEEPAVEPALWTASLSTESARLDESETRRRRGERADAPSSAR